MTAGREVDDCYSFKEPPIEDKTDRRKLGVDR
jgi:hypothetical protein